MLTNDQLTLMTAVQEAVINIQGERLRRALHCEGMIVLMPQGLWDHWRAALACDTRVPARAPVPADGEVMMQGPAGLATLRCVSEPVLPDNVVLAVFDDNRGTAFRETVLWDVEAGRLYEFPQDAFAERMRAKRAGTS